MARSKDVMDNATPAANTLAASGLLRLAALTGEDRYRRAAVDVLELLGEVAAQHPSAFANLLAAAEMDAVGLTEVAVVGDAPELVAVVQRAYRPNVVLAWGEPYPSPLWEGRERRPRLRVPRLRLSGTGDRSRWLSRSSSQATPAAERLIG